MDAQLSFLSRYLKTFLHFVWVQVRYVSPSPTSCFFSLISSVQLFHPFFCAQGSVWIVCSDFLQKDPKDSYLSFISLLFPLKFFTSKFLQENAYFKKIHRPLFGKLSLQWLLLFASLLHGLCCPGLCRDNKLASQRHSSLTNWFALCCINTLACWPVVCIYEVLRKHCKLQRVTMNSKLNLV